MSAQSPTPQPVARIERQRNPGTAVPYGQAAPDFAEPVIGPAEGGTRRLNPGYASDAS
jgi:hypothetical protein